MNKFLEIEKIGTLEVDKILFESYYPILFTCVNEKRELFLCLCCQANREGKKWLITRTSPRTIIKILTNEITLRESFTQYKDIQFTVFLNPEGTQIIANNTSDWDYHNSLLLPDEGEFMDAEKGEFDEEIAYYDKQICDSYEKIGASKVAFTSFDEIFCDYSIEIKFKEGYSIDTQITKQVFNSFIRSINIEPSKKYNMEYHNSSIGEMEIRVKNNFAESRAKSNTQCSFDQNDTNNLNAAA